MRHIITTIVLALMMASCEPIETIETRMTANSITGRYEVTNGEQIWEWRFLPGDRYNRGDLHTTTATGKNTCGLYFFSNNTDTIVIVSGIIPVVRGRLFVEDGGYRIDNTHLHNKNN
jgi:hypothetical protein